MTCSNCDNPNPGSARYCISCGAPLALADVTRPITVPVSAGDAEAEGVDGDDVHRGATTPLNPRSATATGGLTGATIDGKYFLESKIGSGGLGTIYRASRLHIGDTVSVKVLALSPTVDPLAVERVRREAQATGRLKHQNIVATYDYGISKDGLVYLVQELVQGKTLRTVLRERVRLDMQTAFEIASQACSALDEAHANGIVHRNIKPENILLAQETGRFVVKVLDFGVVRMLDVSSPGSPVTPLGAIVGTPQYMSPEQCLGEELDARSDVYSLAVVVYEMLCGAPPFDSEATTAVLMQHVDTPPTPPRTLNASIPPGVERAIMRALEKDRALRPQSAGAFAEEMVLGLADAFADTASMEASAFDTTLNEALPDEAAQLGPFDGAGRRGTGTLAGGSALRALGSPGGETTALPPSPARPEPEPPYAPAPPYTPAPAPPPQPSSRERAPVSLVTVLVPLILILAVAVAAVGGYFAKSYFDSSAARAAVLDEVHRGNLVTPQGQSAFDLYNGRKAGVLSDADRAAIAAEAVPALEAAGSTVLERIHQEGPETEDDWTQSVRVYTWLGELKPQPAYESRLHYAQARLAFLHKDYSKSVAEFQRAIDLDQGYALPLNGIARAYGRLNDRDSAKEYYRRATEVEPDWVIPWLNYGSLCLATGDPVAAEGAFRRAIALDPARPSSHNLLAQAIEKEGRKCDALAEYRAALAAVQANPGGGVTSESVQASIDRVAAGAKCP